ncbi:MAG: serine/threonine-protein kinase [Planctomycetota bacterium]
MGLVPLMPEQLGPYRKVRELDRGAMGAVYEVEHEATGARYALKTILPVLLEDSAGLGERFRREAELLARLDHPHLVAVHSASMTSRPPYLVQDLLTGGTLAARLRRGPLPVADAVEVVSKLARGLAHAHARGVLHRDLKPENVLFDERDEPRVVDFGLALSLGERERLTQTGMVLGSPGYMAPEQALGGKDCDARTDVYALGAVLYACLTGQAPFVRETTLGVLEAVISEAPAPPSRLRPEVGPALDALTLRALAKDAAERPPDASAFVSELAAAATAAAVGPRVPRALIGLAAAAALLALGAVAWAARGGGGGSTPPPSPSAAATTSSPPPVSPAAPRPGWALPAGSVARYRLSWREQEADEPANQFRLRLRRTVERRTASEAWLTLLVEGLQCDLGGRNVHVDSDAKEPPPNGISEAVAGLVGAELRGRQDSRTGELLALEGGPDLKATLPEQVRNSPLFGDLSRQAFSVFSDPSLQRMLDLHWRLFPATAPAPGEPWTLEGVLWIDMAWGLKARRRLTWGEDGLRITLLEAAPRPSPAPGWRQSAEHRVEVTKLEHRVEVTQGELRRSVLELRLREQQASGKHVVAVSRYELERLP